jgi:hypothetical protein
MDTERSPLTPLSRDRLPRIGLSAWPPGQHEHFVRVSPGILTGTRL